jgi:rod shape determining protein RodA
MSKNFIFPKLTYLSKVLLSSLILLIVIGFIMQYSAGGSFAVFAYSYLLKTIISFIALYLTMRINLKLLYSLTDIFYYVSLFLLFLVDIIGITRLGAQRWLDFGFFVVQPSELMKIAIVLMLAKYFHRFSLSQISKLRFYIIPFLLTVAPFFLIVLQPDLGTAIIIISIAAALFFLAGFSIKYFLGALGIVLLVSPIIWLTVLHDYQKGRILTFLDPSRDPLGAGYHITQSKIAIGSGGFTGKGYLSGTQSQLDFLPEKHTDFVFTLLSEEFGFLGALLVIIIYMSIIIVCAMMSHRCQHSYGKYIIAGITTMFFIYTFVNIGMVSGLLPVVGVPLPLISFGGTAMLTNMIGMGLILNIENSQDHK